MRTAITHINVLRILSTILGAIGVLAGDVNVTVDDSGPDPLTKNSIVYTGAWNVGQDCSSCSAQPDDRGKVYNNSWHDNTRNIDTDSVDVAIFNFTGSAVYVYGFLSAAGDVRAVMPYFSDTYLEFFIDGTLHGAFSYKSQNSTSYTYDVPFFSVDSLPHEPHSIQIRNGRRGGLPSLLLFDYLVYTTTFQSGMLFNTTTPSPQASSSGTPSTSSSVRTPPGVALVLSIIALTALVILVVVLVCMHRWRKIKARVRERTSTASTITPNTPSITTNTVPFRTSRITDALAGHRTPSVGTTLVSNICVVQAQICSEPSESPGQTPELTKKAEKLHALIYGGVAPT